MKLQLTLLASLLAILPSASATVNVTSPVNGSTVGSPVTYVAAATAPSCAGGVTAVGIYVNNQLAYKVNGASLNTSLTLSPGSYSTVVKEWDKCGATSNTPIAITVSSGGGAPPPPPGLNVTSPVNNSTVSSPVSFVATASSTTCAKGITAMGVYVASKLLYKVNGNTLNTSLAVANGAQHATVKAWDNCGTAVSDSLTFTVGSVSSSTTVTLSANPTSIAAGSASTLTASATKRHRRHHQRFRRLQLHPQQYRRHAQRQPNRDHHLYRHRNRRIRKCDRDHDSHGHHWYRLHRHHQRQSDRHQRGRSLYPHRRRHERLKGRRCRLGRYQLHPQQHRRHASRLPNRQHHL